MNSNSHNTHRERCTATFSSVHRGSLLAKGALLSFAVLTCSSAILLAGGRGDFNKDGRSSIADFFDLQRNFGKDVLDDRNDQNDPPLRGDDNDDGQVSFADFQQLQVCFGENVPPPVLQGLEVNDAPQPGDILQIRGHGFGDNPDDLCIIVRRADGRFLGAAGQAVGPDGAFVKVPVLPPNFGNGDLVIAVGDGQHPPLPPIPGILPPPNPWVWRGFPGVPAQGQLPDIALPPQDPCPLGGFHGDPPQNGVLCIIIDQPWAQGLRVCIEARVLREDGDMGDTRINDIEFESAGTSFECALGICELIKASFAGHPNRPLQLDCTVTPLPDGSAKITIATVDGVPIVGGNIDIKIKEGRPEIARGLPGAVDLAPDDLLRIAGHGFGDDPDDLCVVVVNGRGQMIPMDNVFAEPGGQALEAIVEAIDEEQAAAGPWNVMIGRGCGDRPKIRPNFPGMVIEANPWGWVGNDANMAVGPPINVIPGPLPPRFTRCFRSGAPVNNTLILCLDEDWGPNTRICLSARIHKQGDNGHDINFPVISFPAGGSSAECAAKICEVLKREFRRRGRPVCCRVIVDPTGVTKIFLRCKSARPMTAGHITVKVKRDPIIIDDVIAGEPGAPLRQGDLIQVQGRGFGDNPDDLCMVLRAAGGQMVNIDVGDIDPAGIIFGNVGAIPPDALGQPFQLGLGVGLGIRPPMLPPQEVEFIQPPWLWVGENADMVLWPAPFDLAPVPDPLCFSSLPPDKGRICLIIDQDWPQGARICIDTRIHKPCDRGHDINFTDVQFFGQGDRLSCALKLCDVLRAGYAARGRPIICNVTPLPDGSIKITVSCRGPERLNAGFIKVRVKPPIGVAAQAPPENEKPVSKLTTIPTPRILQKK